MIKTIAKLLFVVLVTALAWFNLSAAIIAIVAAILVALYDKAGSIIELSFGPLRAKIERDLTEAERLLDKLRQFAAIQARQAISASVHTGRLASGDDWIFVATKRTEAALEALGVSKDQIKTARSDLVRLTLRDLGHAATGGNRLPTQLPKEAGSEWKEARDSGKFAEPDEVESWLKRWDSLTPERAKLIEDMRWIIENQDIQSSEQYLRAHNPIEWEQS